MTLRLELATVQLTLIGSGGSGVGRDGSPHFGPLLLPKVGTSSCWNRRVESLIES